MRFFKGIKWCLLIFLISVIMNVRATGWIKDMSSTWYSNTIERANDNGFYWGTFHIDTIRGVCGTDSCNSYQFGFEIIKYNERGNIVWQKPFYPDSLLLRRDSTESYLAKYYKQDILYNCSDSSGIILKYTLIGVALEGWLEPVFVEYELGSYYSKFDYDGNVLWSNKTTNAENLFTKYEDPFIYGFTYHYKQPESVNFLYRNYSNTYYNFVLRHQYYNNNLDSIITDIDSFNHLIIVDTSIYYDGNVGLNHYRFTKTSDGGSLMNLVVWVSTRDSLSYISRTESYLLKLNAANEKEWIVKLPINNVGVTSNILESTDRFYLAFRENDIASYSKKPIYLYSIDKSGNDSKLSSLPNEMNAMHLRLVNNNVQLIGTSDGIRDGNNDNRSDYTVHFIQYNNQDSAVLIKEVKMPAVQGIYNPTIVYEQPVIDLNNGSSVFGFLYKKTDNTVIKNCLVNIDSLGNVYTTKISGTIFGDKNNNCSVDSSDAFLRNYALRAINSADSFYTSTDTLGKYEMYLDSGNYQLQLLPNPSYPLWKLQNCSIPSTIQLNDGDSTKVDIGLSPTISCTNLTVSLTAPFLRRCFENTYYINYCNNGTVNATNAYIDVALDHFLDFNSSAQAFTNLGNNVFRFHVGNVETGKCGAFSFNVTVNCDSTILGQTHCTEAHIFPDTVCSPIPYTGAIIQASATCKTNKVEFKLKNIGGNMQGDRKYIVIQDQVLRSIQNYNLPGGNELIVDVPLRSGSTYRIEAEQPSDFPSYLGDPKVAAFVEGCRNNTSDTFTTGIISQFPLFDGEPYRAIDCQQNRGSYDPNDKAAKPTGVGAEHFIDKNIPLDYTIRFQNTGTDTAFTVSVIDTISPYLDINSIELEASSHKCNMIRIDSNVIQFLFKEIKLADSTTNLNASNGFVQFHIQQKRNNAIGTQINNFASIYFDYNPAILTNTVFHTIGENYLRVDLISTTKNEQYKYIELTVFPNPFAEKATLLIKNAELKNPILFLMDISGRLVDVVSNNRNEITIYRNKLSAGFYTYKLMDGNTEVATGKIIVQ